MPTGLPVRPGAHEIVVEAGDPVSNRNKIRAAFFGGFGYKVNNGSLSCINIP